MVERENLNNNNKKEERDNKEHYGKQRSRKVMIMKDFK